MSCSDTKVVAQGAIIALIALLAVGRVEVTSSRDIFPCHAEEKQMAWRGCGASEI